MRDRVKEFRRVKASELQANPGNWRIHPAHQKRLLEQMVDEIGFTSVVVTWVNEDGDLEILNGHLRTDVAGDEEIPIIILDLTKPEADKVLAFTDQVTGQASADGDALSQLVDTLEHSSYEGRIEPQESLRYTVGEFPHQRMAWMLVGVPVSDGHRLQSAAAEIRERVPRACISTCAD